MILAQSFVERSLFEEPLFKGSKIFSILGDKDHGATRPLPKAGFFPDQSLGSHRRTGPRMKRCLFLAPFG
ncbi:MAG: hypothetical protein C5B49_06765 [Bdellovibrio sp.]|nr:MAG: hypothetical protein C5B49_06765 [Bdellovibrio sp.]